MEMKKKNISETVSIPRQILRKHLGFKNEHLNPNFIRTTVPSLPYELFDYTGKTVLPWSLIKLSDSSEIGDYWCYTKKGSDAEDFTMYLLNYEVKVDKSFYRLDTPKAPLVMELTVKYVKKSSRCIECRIRHQSLSAPYIVMSGVDVNMDPIKRVPKPFPAWWKDYFKFPDQGERLEFKYPPKPTVGVFSTQHRVEFSDTDENKHTNYSVYIRMSYNSMCENILAGNYGTDLSVYDIGLKSLQITFLKDCGLGDVLTVQSWENQAAVTNTFYFEIYKDSMLCTKLTMSMYNLLDISEGPPSKL